MTTKKFPDDDFDADPGVPGAARNRSPFDDDDDDFSLESLPQGNAGIGDQRYAEIARELSEMDAAIDRGPLANNGLPPAGVMPLDDFDDLQQEFDQRANQSPLAPARWDQPADDFESLQDLTLDETREPDSMDHEVAAEPAHHHFDGGLEESNIEPTIQPAIYHEPVDAIHLNKTPDNTESQTFVAPEVPSLPSPPFDDFTTDAAPDMPAPFEAVSLEKPPIPDDMPATAPTIPAPTVLAPLPYDDFLPTDEEELPPPPAVAASIDDFEPFDAPPSIISQPIATASMGETVADITEAEFFDDDPAQPPPIYPEDNETDNDDDDSDDDSDALPPPVMDGTRIPLMDLGSHGFDRLALGFHKRARAAQGLLQRRYSLYGVDLLSMIDQKCAKWLATSNPPYRIEIETIANKLKAPGTYAMNLFFEFGCTTAVAPDAEGGSRLLHTMDWSLTGLGRMIVAARRDSEHGSWVNITWPGYVGSLQGIAPGRFAAVINQAPTGTSKQPWINWVTSKLKWQNQKDMPPSFLLRRAFEECKDFDSAVALIEKTPICFPAIFTVVGIQEGEFAVIERTENDRKTQKRQMAVTNHWLNSDFSGRPIGYKSEDRLVAVKSRLSKGVDGWDWLRPPVLNPTTRIAMDLNPKTARMRIIGYEGLDPVTAPLDIYAD